MAERNRAAGRAVKAVHRGNMRAAHRAARQARRAQRHALRLARGQRETLDSGTYIPRRFRLED